MSSPLALRLRRPRAAPVAALLAALLAAGAPAAARGQSSAAFQLCLAGTVQGCTRLDVTTTALGHATLVDVVVRQSAAGALGIALMDFALFFPPQSAADAAAAPVLALQEGHGARPAAAPAAWSVLGLERALVFRDATPLVPSGETPSGETETQYVASCRGGGPLRVGAVVAPLTTCGDERYTIRAVTAALFDATSITGLGVNLLVGPPDVPDAVASVVTCDVGAERLGMCIDFGNLLDPEVPHELTVRGNPQPSTSIAPEPASLALTAAGLALLPFARRSRRGGVLDAPVGRPRGSGAGGSAAGPM